jgi:hypothetical protein
MITTQFGQHLEVGSIVGWGRRLGNNSSQQVGIVLELVPYETKRWNPETRHMEDTTLHKAKCWWVAGGRTVNYKSTTEAEELFRLSMPSLDPDLQRKLVASFELVPA